MKSCDHWLVFWYWFTFGGFQECVVSGRSPPATLFLLVPSTCEMSLSKMFQTPRSVQQTFQAGAQIAHAS